MPVQRTLVLVKPDGVQRGLVGEVITRLERRGLKIVGMKFLHVTNELAHKHYAEHEGKPFFPGLVSFITSSPIVAMAVEGKDAIAAVRQTMGATNPVQAAPGSIRADFGLDIGRNVVHGSANEADAEREVALYFTEKELFSYIKDHQRWLTE
jgi:nucleoside-diphosphate kinase